MEIEKQRGISISTTVLRFEYQNYQINLLDTPGHKDFSEDTYRTLVAADAAVMLIDAAKGVEPQTLKLFEVCRMRGLPIFTFINKMDRPSRDPLELIDELEKVLGIRSSPISWPIGMGDRFKGVYDRRKEEVLFFQAEDKAHASRQIPAKKIGHIASADFLSVLNPSPNQRDEVLELQNEVRTQLELLEIAGDPFDFERVLRGELTPVFFGSAMNNFGVQHFLDNFLEMAPAPTSRVSNAGPIDPSSDFSGVFFKIQANIDPQHRDRVSFFRVCSGKFTRGMEAQHGRLKQNFKLNKAFHFFAQERNLIEEAWPGDIVGFLDTSGDFRIGDTLCSGKHFEYEGVPRFSPENFASVSLADPLKRKQLKKGLDQLSEEGVVQIFRSVLKGDAQPILGVVGSLQFDVLQHRIKTEYSVEMRIERMSFSKARWIVPQEPHTDISKELSEFSSYADCLVVSDRDSLPVVLFKSDWSMNWATGKYPQLKFLPSAPLN
jgi:peptide chain release factor 3